MASTRRPAWQYAATALLAALGLYLIARAGVEVAQVDYGNPASYRNDWGGPSLAGVLAVHCGPGVVALGLFGRYLSGMLTRR